MKVSAVVPCFNEELVVPALACRLSSVLKGNDWDYEIVLVDDGSRDDTWRIIRQLRASDQHFIGVRLSKNHGHQLALAAGLAQATGDRILMIDSDLQDPPELIPEMMKLMDEGAEVVYGQRLSREGVPVWKRFCYKAFYKLLSFMAGSEIPQDSGDFRMISRTVADHLNAMPENHRFIRGMISWIGYKQVPLFYDRSARYAGGSHYTLAKLFRLAIDGITSFSIQPLRIAALFAVFTGILALCGLVYIIVGWWLHHPVQGWTSLSVIILFLGSMQLFVLGIVGEYLGRLFIESKRRPIFVIAEIIGGKFDTK